MLSKNTVVVSIHPFFYLRMQSGFYLYKRWGKTEIAEATEVTEVIEAIEANQALRLLRPHM